ncbi:MAG: tetratricopeptide repeat protein [Armatimonadetes bacterium]|nr:tetratricopeptide repeat protein [Armatimonadota bacterium]
MENLDRYYLILELRYGASLEEIEGKYQDLLERYRRDLQGNNPRLQRRAEERLKEVTEAYEGLKLYHASRAAQASRAPQVAPSRAEPAPMSPPPPPVPAPVSRPVPPRPEVPASADQSSRQLADEEEARPFLQEAEQHLQREEWVQAISVLRRAVEVAPESAVVRSKLGVALAHSGKHAEALEEFSRAVALNRRYAAAYSNMGNVYLEQGKLDQAVEAYQKAIDLDPDYWIAHQNLGVVYKRMGRLDLAVGQFKKATRLSLKRATTPEEGAPRRRLGCLPGAAASMLVLIAAAYLLR